ncbi:MAG: dihydroorotate dehydrogenase electron transfer subunit [Dehalococcoidia bacterium]|nr:dihydroorotate dehydrogenase electron transfer subunit [Dehalococcoidia bacterium]
MINNQNYPQVTLNEPQLATMELAEIVFSQQIAHGLHLLQVEAPQITLSAKAGQFVMLHCDGGAFLRRPLSIHRINYGKKWVSFLFAVVGKGTQWLAQTKAGAHVDLLGPLGNGFNLLPTTKSILLLAGGLGLAPLVFLADEAIRQGMKVSLAYGTSTAQRYDRRELPLNINLIEYSDDGSYGKRGAVTECLPSLVDEVEQVFACGPLPMYRALACHPCLAGKNVQVSLETRMACGLGVCNGCTIKTYSGNKQVCNHGPVFALSEVVWDEMAPV